MRASRKQFRGLPITPGIAIGRAHVVIPGELKLAEATIPASRIQQEIAALDQAIADTLDELRSFRATAGKKVSGPVAKIFDAQLLIAGDYEFLKLVKEDILQNRYTAAFAYSRQVEQTTHPLRSSPDHYMQQMALDIESVAKRVVSHLVGEGAVPNERFSEETILVGRVFSPGEVLSLRGRKGVGFVVAEGGRNSHMALIAGSLMTPVVSLENDLVNIPNDSMVIIDGTTGTIIVEPNEDDFAEYQKLRKKQGPAVVFRIRKLTEIPPRTADGQPISIAANLELPGPVDEILAEQRIPVGLYRTEFLYIQASQFPDEETQFGLYSQIAERFAKSEVILRTFDIGSDKSGADDMLPHEENPALGWRGIRTMLDLSDLFKDQIRAILRASARKNLSIMLPMVSDVAEYDRAKKLIGQVMLEMRRDKMTFDDRIQVGIMVEVPSAALMADRLAQRVDFISIGTNDLTQYTLSADRNNPRVADLYNCYHPSVLRLIKMTVEACKRHAKPVSICGEMAGDLLALPLFIGMGVNQLSMTPAKIFDMCRLVKKIDASVARLLVEPVVASSSVTAVTRKLESYRAALEKK